jgi:hypothetical protein
MCFTSNPESQPIHQRNIMGSTGKNHVQKKKYDQDREHKKMKIGKNW